MVTKPVQIANAALGMDLLSDETAMPENAMRDIENFDVDEAGLVSRRKGARLLASVVGCHSHWAPRHERWSLYADGTTLKRLRAEGSSLQSSTLLTGLSPSLRIRYHEHADEVFFTNGRELGVVSDSGARLLGLLAPDGAPALVDVQGGMAVGRYGVAISFVSASGEESALSPAEFIECAQGGVQVALPQPDGVASIRVYVTPTNGSLLYLATEVPVGFASVRVQDEERSKLPAAQFMARMPAGDDISVYNGRVYVSQGSLLRFSQPFAYGLTDPRSDFIDCKSRILFHEPVADGLYVGTADGTLFLGGATPKDAAMRRVGPAAVVDDSIVVDPAQVGVEGASPVAVWLSREGFCIGSAGGAVSAAQSKRIKLADHGTGALAAITDDGISRVLALVEATQPHARVAATTLTS